MSQQAGKVRRALLSVMGAAAAGVALASTPARAQSGAPAPGKFSPARHKEDEWLDTVPGKHRVFIDTASLESASEGVLYAGNLFVANKSGYGLDDGDIATIVCFRHYSTIFAFTNTIWAKYGKPLADSSKYVNAKSPETPTTNPQRNIDALAKRGVHFAVCGLATKRIAGLIATATSGNADEIMKELAANLVPNGHLVAAGVIATTRAQEYGYSLLVAG